MYAIRETSTHVENEPIFKTFCSNRELAEKSIKIYKYGLQKYSDFTGKTLKELIDEAEDEEDSINRYRKRKIYSYLNNFKLYLDELDIAQYSKNHTMILVRAFYNEFDIQLPRPKKKKSKKARMPETVVVLPTMEEIKRFLEYCNNEYKAIVLMGISSGMGRAEISSLTFRNFYDSIPLEKYPSNIPELIEKVKPKVKQEETFVPLWKIKRIKTDNLYYTFSSPESVERIITYLEDLNHNFPSYEPNPDDKLFRSLISNNPTKPTDISSMFNHIGRKKGFRKVGEHYVVRSHGFRKFFATTLQKNRVPHLTTRWLMGHTIDSTTSAYFKVDPESLREEYIEVVDKLTTDNVQIKIIDKYESLSEQISYVMERIRQEEGEIKFKDKIDREKELGKHRS
ncbi:MULTISPECIES: tyrosine-type recombinase/integrase [Methanobacterium]|uniref:Site-specific integrase n=1 Tax=Methanobacterium veterum TaxID=408577 RepID=A0A9E5A6X5_9EURY|nr:MULTISPECIES: site-specific integrase [Methanobacterium]MCZ3366659.1 site-specific integrase [Methanobacterium veterum]MCZ3374196.1 site-specific integrase [Methanobacterium veterum]